MEPTYTMSLKIYWSLFWRTLIAYICVLLMFMGVLSLIFVALFGSAVGQLEDLFITMGMKIVFVFVLVAVWLVLCLYINRWVLNRLLTINYREGHVIFMNNTTKLEKVSLFDTICILWSHTWRHIILLFPIYAVLAIVFMSQYGAENAPYFFHGPYYNHIEIVAEFFVGVSALQWMISRKKVGRWICLEAR